MLDTSDNIDTCNNQTSYEHNDPPLLRRQINCRTKKMVRNLSHENIDDPGGTSVHTCMNMIDMKNFLDNISIKERVIIRDTVSKNTVLGKRRMSDDISD